MKLERDISEDRKKETGPENAGERAALLANELETSHDENFIRERLPELLSILENDLGLEMLKGPEVARIYHALEREQCFVRVERFTKIMNVLERGQPFSVGEGDSFYANAVIAEPEGIKLAFAEGHASGPLKTALAIGKSLVGFKPDRDHLTVSPVDFAKEAGIELRDIEKRNYLCRHIDGVIEKDDIRAVVMRIPGRLLSDELLTDLERGETPPQFVFRGFFVDGKAAESLA